MKKLFLVLLLLLPAVGCMSFRATGPLAGQMGAPAPTTKQSRTDPNAQIALDPLGVPTLPEAPPPPAPTQLVTPSEIDAANAGDAVKKLMQEIETDRKMTEQFPNYPVVSKIERK